MSLAGGIVQGTHFKLKNELALHSTHTKRWGNKGQVGTTKKFLIIVLVFLVVF